MINRRQLGQYYEEQACLFLCGQGLTLIAQNSVSKLGEIDLIMKDKTCLVFVEVRYRKSAQYGDAQSTITITKQNRVIRAAYCWMQQQKIDIENSEFRFDVFAITGQHANWLKSAFSHE